MIGYLRTLVIEQPIIELYFEFENELKFFMFVYNIMLCILMGIIAYWKFQINNLLLLYNLGLRYWLVFRTCQLYYKIATAAVKFSL